MKTKKGKRTAHFGVQIVENPNDITLFFDGHDLRRSSSARRRDRAARRLTGS